MSLLTQRKKFFLLSFIRHDLKASITVFFVALPLCLGISLASGVPVSAGIMAGLVGGLVIPWLSRSPLSVSGPAAGLTAICIAAIAELGSMEAFFFSVALAGAFQVMMGSLKLGGFTHLIPSSVIKGMMTAIGILLIAKQIPLLIGYAQPDFWSNQLFNILTFDHGFAHVHNLYSESSGGAAVITTLAFVLLWGWKRWAATRYPFLPASFIIVLFGASLALLFEWYLPALRLSAGHYVTVQPDLFGNIGLPDFQESFHHDGIWKQAVIICFVASLETLLSVEAIDKLDPWNRVTPPNRELVAQGVGNFLSGLLGGLPITAVIVRSAANAEAGGKTRLASFLHGVWLLAAVLVAFPLLNHIPYCVLAVILIRTGFNLARPVKVRTVYQQGREQFLPFMVTILAILLTNLLAGVLIGVVYAVYFLIKHTYRAGYSLKETTEGHIRHFVIDLALNVSFLNKRRFVELLDSIPDYSIVEINGADSLYIDHDVLEIFQVFKTKARIRHIEVRMVCIPEVEIMTGH